MLTSEASQLFRWFWADSFTTYWLCIASYKWFLRPPLTVSTNFRQPRVITNFSPNLHKQLFCWFSHLERHQASVPNNHCLSASLVIAYYGNVFCIPGVLSQIQLLMQELTSDTYSIPDAWAFNGELIDWCEKAKFSHLQRCQTLTGIRGHFSQTRPLPGSLC